MALTAEQRRVFREAVKHGDSKEIDRLVRGLCADSVLVFPPKPKRPRRKRGAVL